MMITVYLNVLLITIIFTTPAVVFSHDSNEINTQQAIEKKHIIDLAQPHHGLDHTLSNIQYRKYFREYMLSFVSLQGFKRNLVFWAASTALEDFIKYECKDDKATDKMWDKAKNFMNQIGNKLNNTYVSKLYSAIQSKNKNDLMSSVASIREYCYKSLETPFKFFQNYFRTINNNKD